MLLTIVIVGIIWAIVFGVEVYNKSNENYDPKNLITVSFVRPPPILRPKSSF